MRRPSKAASSGSKVTKPGSWISMTSRVSSAAPPGPAYMTWSEAGRQSPSPSLFAKSCRSAGRSCRSRRPSGEGAFTRASSQLPQTRTNTQGHLNTSEALVDPKVRRGTVTFHGGPGRLLLSVSLMVASPSFADHRLVSCAVLACRPRNQVSATPAANLPATAFQIGSCNFHNRSASLSISVSL